MQGSTLASMESLGNIPNWIRCPRFPRVCWHNFSKIWFLCPRFKMTVEFWKALINWDIFYFNSESGSNTGRRFWTSSRVFNQTHFISNSILHPIENSGFRFSNVQEFKHEGLIFLMHTRTLHNVNENFVCSLAPPGGQNQKSESIASKFVMSWFCCKNFLNSGFHVTTGTSAKFESQKIQTDITHGIIRTIYESHWKPNRKKFWHRWILLSLGTFSVLSS